MLVPYSYCQSNCSYSGKVEVFSLIKCTWKIENELNVCKRQADINQWRTREGTTDRECELCMQAHNANPAGSLCFRASPRWDRGSGRPHNLNPRWYFQPCLFTSKCCSGTNPEPTAVRGAEPLVLSGDFVPLMRIERGAQGWNATPKRKIYLPDR